MDTFNALMRFARMIGSFDGGDQGLLNLFFDIWAMSDIARHLPFVYNLAAQAFYTYESAYRKFRDSTKVCRDRKFRDNRKVCRDRKFRDRREVCRDRTSRDSTQVCRGR